MRETCGLLIAGQGAACGDRRATGELQGCGHESDQSCIRSPTGILVRAIGGSTGSSRPA